VVVILYCVDCVVTGPDAVSTPLGLAFRTEENRQAWPVFLTSHLEREHIVRMLKVP